MRESEIEQHLVKRVEQLGGEVRKVKWIGRRGAPDRLVMLPEVPTQQGGIFKDPDNPARCFVRATRLGVQGRTVWVELKAPGEKAKPHQLREHERMRRMGQTVVVLDSIEAVDNWLGGNAQ